MAEITEAAAMEFVRNEVKAYSGAALELYYLGKRVLSEYNGRTMSDIVTIAWPCPVGDQNLTGNEVLNLMNRISEYISDLEANNCAKLNTIIQIKG